MASKPRKPRPGRRAKPRRAAPASARKQGRRPTAAPKAKRATTVRARKAAGAKTPKKAGSKKRPASKARPPARKAPPKASPAPRPRPPRTTARARRAKVPIGLLRERRTLSEEPPRDDRQDDENRYSGAARSGQDGLLEKLLEHTSTGPVMTGGDIDGDWESAYSSGDEAPGGDNPTPDQGQVDDNGKALGIHYDDNEELRLGDKEAERDVHRWELDPASAEDYGTRDEE